MVRYKQSSTNRARARAANYPTTRLLPAITAIILALLITTSLPARAAMSMSPVEIDGGITSSGLRQDVSGQGLSHQMFRQGLIAFARGHYSRAVERWRFLAELGHAPSQFRLGIMLDEGIGTEKNHVEAIRWYSKAAYQGHPAALYYYGVAYANGLGGKDVDMKKAATWWHHAAHKGNADAQYNLGVLYFAGHGVDQNRSKAAHWWFKAAQQGDPAAQFRLGVLLLNGEGVDRDLDAAMRWWGKSADQGYDQAIEALNTIHDMLVKTMH